jgi:hypothetical protein
MLIILAIAVLAQVGLQYYIDHGLVDSILGQDKYAPWFRYQLAQSLLTRFLWNILTAGLIGFMFGSIGGLYGPIAVIIGFGIYEVTGELYLHRKWVRAYLVHQNTIIIDKFINKKVKELRKLARKAGHEIDPEQAREAVKKKYAAEIEALKDESRRKSKESTEWLMQWMKDVQNIDTSEKMKKEKREAQMNLKEEILADK